MSAISLRLPDSLHKRVKELAHRDRDKFLKALKKVPGRKPDAYDKR
jgi:predicted transcriptional regulator